jgi:hypothetical protein
MSVLSNITFIGYGDGSCRQDDDVHRGNIRNNMGKSSYMIYDYEMSYMGMDQYLLIPFLGG